MTDGRAARRPSQWADAQRTLVQQLRSGGVVPETPAIARWWTSEATWFPPYGGWISAPVAAFQGIRALVRRQRRGPSGSFIALWRDAAAEDGPDLVVEVDERDLPSIDGAGPVTVLGEFAVNGALCIAIGGQRIMPIYNPRRPWGDLAKRTRALPPG